MLKKVISICVVLLFAASSFSYAGMKNEDIAAYESQKKGLNDQMKTLGDDYKQQMKDSDKSYMDKFGKLDKGDKEGRKALLKQKRTAKEQLQMDYRKKHQTLKDQVDALKQTRRQDRETAGKTKKEMKKETKETKKGDMSGKGKKSGKYIK